MPDATAVVRYQHGSEARNKAVTGGLISSRRVSLAAAQLIVPVLQHDAHVAGVARPM